ncbi:MULTISPECIES: ABC transporter permease [unclassified Chelatococcus]|uniref:ABC transporter permease n=1 Tax=unclassified Chelatococcus TaxID=2638111 RepID=UPI001BD060C7|nr:MULTISPECIES: ABC transporter permease [unclassified Chelatococcus]MBS7700438.1 ABC transporter permease [Chelatococcus sp. YT9]MBX3556234.1 ABC transporter permease [Chelatococcus sp.]
MPRQIAFFLFRRLALTIPILFGVMLFAFVLVRLGGQEPVALLGGPTASAQQLEEIRQELGLDKSIPEQFAVYAGKVLSLDLGTSWLNNRPVLGDLLSRIPATLELLLLGVGLGALIGIPTGLHAATHPNGRFDHLSRFLSLLGFSIPTYWLGLLVIFVFFYLLGWAPPPMGRISLMVTPPPAITGSYVIDALLAADTEALSSAAAQLALPVLCLAIVAAAPIIKQTRAIALDVLSSDFVRYARASGLPPRVMKRLVLRNSLVPLITFIGTELAGLVGTSSLIELVFAWGGAGQYGLSAIIQGDFVAVQGYVLYVTLASLVIFLVVDLAVILLEPRVQAL